jgi:hypothetical protein
MTERVLGPTGGRRRKRLAIFVPPVAVAALILAIAAAAGPSSASGFEGSDANLIVNSTFDWNSFATTTWTGTAPARETSKVASGWSLKGIEDAQETTSDSAFAGGTKQDDACANVGAGKAPNKDDLNRIYIASKTVGTHTYLALAWARIPQNTTSSSAHVAFEFNQNATLCPGTGHDGLVPRSTANGGDMLIVYDFEGGDSPVILKLLRWKDSSTDAAGDLCDASGKAVPAAPAGCWVLDEILTGTGNGEAAVNQNTVADGIAPTPGNLQSQEFGEAIIDLTGAGVFPETPTSCLSFGKVFGVSRSSGNSAQAQMKDLVGPATVSISNCATVIIHKVTSPSTDTTTVFSFSKNFNTDPASSNSFTLTGGTCSPATSSCTKTYSGNVFPRTGAMVSESDPNGLTPSYSLTTIVCTAGSTATSIVPTVNAGGAGGNVTFDIAAGQSLECTFTNTRNKAPSTLSTAPWIYPNDKATIAQNDATGAVTFKLFGAASGNTAQQNCLANGNDASGGLLYSQSVNLPVANPNEVNTSNMTVKVSSSATVYWRVAYAGDTNYLPDLSDCVENIAVTLNPDAGS